ncbi:hypothetical protein EGY25_12015 [Brevundimonas intermedia]|uniref:Uncharacterized protein n=1 Tax=Brevundimonas intermedia TaxID=74315 RepID=A0A4Y9RYG1_9CAUL|nr:hypothetical protein [Brevundimonas intermedia]TFW12709.1 hypothetical protein EGY25_12015 [Brevundimonas intermedia]
MSDHVHDRSCRRPRDFRTGDDAACTTACIRSDSRPEQRSAIGSAACISCNPSDIDAGSGPHDDASPAADWPKSSRDASPGADDISRANASPNAQQIDHASSASHWSKPGCDASFVADDVVPTTGSNTQPSDYTFRYGAASSADHVTANAAGHQCDSGRDACTRHDDATPRSARADRA